MAKPKITNVTGDCWRSPWRPVGTTEEGRPLRYLLLNMEEMLIAAKTGVIRVPDSQIPEVVRRQRDRVAVIDEYGLDKQLLTRVSLA